MTDPCLEYGIDPTFSGVGVEDRAFLAQFIRSHPQWRDVIEFGTYVGVTAQMIGALLHDRGGQCYSIDYEVPNRWPHMGKPGVELFAIDLLTNAPHPDAVALIQRLAPCLVVMDNGHKVTEVRCYAPLLPVGSAFVVHDWAGDVRVPNMGGEMYGDDIADVITADRFAPLWHAEAAALGSSFRAWERIA